MTAKTRNVIRMELETEFMAPNQIRLLRQVNHILMQLATTDDEEAFFRSSAEALRLCASMIKQSNFAGKLEDAEEIPYGDQALEYSLDSLNEHILKSKVVTFDN